MDARLFEAVKLNDKLSFGRLVQEDRSMLLQQESKSLSTILHVASRMERTELARKIVELCPDMVALENAFGEIPLHEVSRNGNAHIAMLLLETNPWVASTLNSENQSAFSIAFRKGHLDVVKLLLNQQWLMDIEVERMDLHELISTENINIVREILKVRPQFALKTDKNGCVALHYACKRSQLEITRLLLEFAARSAKKFNKNCYTPLHFAAMNGDAAILMEFMSLAPMSFYFLTRNKENAFHLAVKFGRYESFVPMAEFFRNSDLIQKTDQYGNTVLHLAVSARCYQIAEYIINATEVDVKCRNHDGHTALDLLNQATRATSEAKRIRDMLIKIGCPESSKVPLPSSALNTPNAQNLKIYQESEKLSRSIMSSSSNADNRLNKELVIEVERSDTTLFTTEEIINTTESEQVSPETNELDQHRHRSERRRKYLSERQKGRRDRQYKTHWEALQNARNTIILVAILIATVAFTVGLNPPGGVYQEEGATKGQSIAGRKMAFKIFAISNSIALFTSLCIVIILMSIIPFQRKKLMWLMVITHKVMWVAISFMATAFIAACWVIMPHDHETWMLECLVAVGASSLVTVFIYLGVQIVRHWLRKLKYRKERGKKTKISAGNTKKSIRKGKSRPRIRAESESSNSDFEGAKSLGCHTY